MNTPTTSAVASAAPAGTSPVHPWAQRRPTVGSAAATTAAAGASRWTVAGGVNGSPALSVPKSGGVWIDGKLPLRPVGPTWTVRFKAKPLRDLTQVEVLVWTGKPGISYWYHVRGLKRDEWNSVEVKASQLNRDWRGNGSTFEGDVAQVLKFYYDDDAPDGSILLDDVEVTE